MSFLCSKLCCVTIEGRIEGILKEGLRHQHTRNAYYFQIFIYLWDKVSICSSGWPETLYIVQVGLKLTNPPASLLWLLIFQVWAATPNVHIWCLHSQEDICRFFTWLLAPWSSGRCYKACTCRQLILLNAASSLLITLVCTISINSIKNAIILKHTFQAGSKSRFMAYLISSNTAT